jgi:hypothetical protein
MIGTNARNMNEPFDSGSPRLSRDPLGRLDVDGMKRLKFPLDVKADCVHRAVSISKRIDNGPLIPNVHLNRSKLWIIRTKQRMTAVRMP